MTNIGREMARDAWWQRRSRDQYLRETVPDCAIGLIEPFSTGAKAAFNGRQVTQPDPTCDVAIEDMRHYRNIRAERVQSRQ